MIRFVYRSRERIAEPHVAGIKDGKEGMLTYQTGGSSSSGGLPMWRRFELGEVSQLVILDDAFPGKRDAPSGKHSRWDEIYAIVD